MASFRLLVLALAFGLGAAVKDFKPSVDFNLGHDKLGSGMNVDSLRGEVALEGRLNDDLSVGATLHRGEQHPLKSLFAKLSHSLGDNGRVKADLSVGLADNAVAGELTYSEGDNEVVAVVNSKSDDVVESVEYTRKGNGWLFRPRFNVRDRALDLEAETQINDDTLLNVKVNQGGDSEVELSYRSDDKTAWKASSNTKDLHLEVERDIDENNSVRPSFDLGSKHLTLAWIRRLGDERKLTATVDPENSVDLELEGNDNDWTAKLSAPWNSPRDVDVSFGRKFDF
mmetsp:Transcript_8470/g.12511  ORF Transcript_8470/g.12511 Transcript_8470/m.12511 type:complete len:284 (+) Transcript_8470:95-946(+)